MDFVITCARLPCDSGKKSVHRFSNMYDCRFDSKTNKKLKTDTQKWPTFESQAFVLALMDICEAEAFYIRIGDRQKMEMADVL